MGTASDEAVTALVSLFFVFLARYFVSIYILNISFQNLLCKAVVWVTRCDAVVVPKYLCILSLK